VGSSYNDEEDDDDNEDDDEAARKLVSIRQAAEKSTLYLMGNCKLLIAKLLRILRLTT
jgi:hypothetical protein